MEKELSDEIDLDFVLVKLGQIGPFQKRNFFLICLVVVFAAYPISYIFTTRNSDYRCLIKDCDDPGLPIYNASWIKFAIPISNSKTKQCSHYGLNDHVALYNCDNTSFNQNEEVQCDRFVFENGDATIERDFNITCEHNLIKLTAIGTIDNVGELLFLPLSGLISDKFGRRALMVYGVLAGTICGLIKTFTTTYWAFVLFEFLEFTLSCGIYSAAFILAIELVPPNRRVLASTITSCAFAFGEALLGFVAWSTGSWRVMLRVLYAPGVLFIFYFWLVNESVRWLLSKGRVREARHILLQVASMNRSQLPDDALNKLSATKNDDNVPGESYWTIFKSSKITIRLITCSLVWISCVFVYYGFTLHAVAISGSVYFNFIAVSCVEIPAYFLNYYTLDVLGRKKSLSISLILGGLASIAFIFVPEESSIIRLVLFLIGKFTVTNAFTTLYIYTAELFPTTVRHQLLATCSTCGRIGSMVAPQIPLLAKISPSLPLILFGAMATSAGILALTFPETQNITLPSTIKEAEKIEFVRDYA